MEEPENDNNSNNSSSNSNYNAVETRPSSKSSPHGLRNNTLSSSNPPNSIVLTVDIENYQGKQRGIDLTKEKKEIYLFTLTRTLPLPPL